MKLVNLLDVINGATQITVVSLGEPACVYSGPARDAGAHILPEYLFGDVREVFQLFHPSGIGIDVAPYRAG